MLVCDTGDITASSLLRDLPSNHPNLAYLSLFIYTSFGLSMYCYLTVHDQHIPGFPHASVLGEDPLLPNLAYLIYTEYSLLVCDTGEYTASHY